MSRDNRGAIARVRTLDPHGPRSHGADGHGGHRAACGRDRASSSGSATRRSPMSRRSCWRASWAQFEYGVFAYTWVWFLVFSTVATVGFGDSPVRYIAQLRARGRGQAICADSCASRLPSPRSARVVFGVLLIALLPLAGALDRKRASAADGDDGDLHSLRRLAGRAGSLSAEPITGRFPRSSRSTSSATACCSSSWSPPSSSDSTPNAVSGFICLILTLVVSTLYQAIAILRRLRRVVPPGPRAYRPREWLRGSLPFAVIYTAQHICRPSPTCSCSPSSCIPTRSPSISPRRASSTSSTSSPTPRRSARRISSRRATRSAITTTCNDSAGR